MAAPRLDSDHPGLRLLAEVASIFAAGFASEDALTQVVGALRRGLALRRCRLWLRDPAGGGYAPLTTPGDEAVLRDIRECGFNLAGFVSAENVSAIVKAGLKCIVSGINVDSAGDDEAVKKMVTSVTEKWKDSPAVYGYYVRDEPTSSLSGHLPPARKKWPSTASA